MDASKPSQKSKSPARLLGLREIEAEYGIPYGLLYDLVHRPKNGLRTVRVPGVRRIFVDREDLEAAIASWKEAAR